MSHFPTELIETAIDANRQANEALAEGRPGPGLRQVRRGRKSLNALPEKGLTTNQRRARIFMLDRLKDTEQAIRRSIRDQRQVRPTPTIPRRPVTV
jgi:hypothetical protein